MKFNLKQFLVFIATLMIVALSFAVTIDSWYQDGNAKYTGAPDIPVDQVLTHNGTTTYWASGVEIILSQYSDTINGENSYTMKLLRWPDASLESVTITPFDVIDPTIATKSYLAFEFPISSLIFTNANYSTPKIFKIKAIDDINLINETHDIKFKIVEKRSGSLGGTFIPPVTFVATANDPDFAELQIQSVIQLQPDKKRLIPVALSVMPVYEEVIFKGVQAGSAAVDVPDLVFPKNYRGGAINLPLTGVATDKQVSTIEYSYFSGPDEFKLVKKTVTVKNDRLLVVVTKNNTIVTEDTVLEPQTNGSAVVNSYGLHLSVWPDLNIDKIKVTIKPDDLFNFNGAIDSTHRFNIDLLSNMEFTQDNYMTKQPILIKTYVDADVIDDRGTIVFAIKNDLNQVELVTSTFGIKTDDYQIAELVLPPSKANIGLNGSKTIQVFLKHPLPVGVSVTFKPTIVGTGAVSSAPDLVFTHEHQGLTVTLNATGANQSNATITYACADGCLSEFAHIDEPLSVKVIDPKLSCKAHYDIGRHVDGIYAINPGGVAPFEVYCDMTTDGGGWTLVIGIAANNNHVNQNSVTPENLKTLTGKGKYSDSVINSIITRTADDYNLSVTCDTMQLKFHSQCVLNSAATASGACLKFKTNDGSAQSGSAFTAHRALSAWPASYLILNENDAGCSANGRRPSPGVLWVR